MRQTSSYQTFVPCNVVIYNTKSLKTGYRISGCNTVWDNHRDRSKTQREDVENFTRQSTGMTSADVKPNVTSSVTSNVYLYECFYKRIIPRPRCWNCKLYL